MVEELCNTIEIGAAVFVQVPVYFVPQQRSQIPTSITPEGNHATEISLVVFEREPIEPMVASMQIAPHAGRDFFLESQSKAEATFIEIHLHVSHLFAVRMGVDRFYFCG
jgi:hypothetical protein